VTKSKSSNGGFARIEREYNIVLGMYLGGIYIYIFAYC
jgi:hypothetical protein